MTNKKAIIAELEKEQMTKEIPDFENKEMDTLEPDEIVKAIIDSSILKKMKHDDSNNCFFFL